MNWFRSSEPILVLLSSFFAEPSYPYGLNSSMFNLSYMPKWSKDAKEFTVNVHHSDDKGTQIRLPKPVLEKMGNPDKVTFVIDGKDIRVTSEGKPIPKKSLSWKKKKELT